MDTEFLVQMRQCDKCDKFSLHYKEWFNAKKLNALAVPKQEPIPIPTMDLTKRLAEQPKITTIQKLLTNLSKNLLLLKNLKFQKNHQ